MKLSFLSLLVLIVGFFNATEAHAKSGKKISRADLKYIADILQTGKLGDDLICKYQIREGRNLVKFRNGSEWIDNLEFQFEPKNSYSATEIGTVISEGDVVKFSKVHDSEYGIVEQIDIEIQDLKTTFIEIRHNGQGTITRLLQGSDQHIYPCQTKYRVY